MSSSEAGVDHHRTGSEHMQERLSVVRVVHPAPAHRYHLPLDLDRVRVRARQEALRGRANDLSGVEVEGEHVPVRLEDDRAWTGELVRDDPLGLVLVALLDRVACEHHRIVPYSLVETDEVPG